MRNLALCAISDFSFAGKSERSARHQDLIGQMSKDFLAKPNFIQFMDKTLNNIQAGNNNHEASLSSAVLFVSMLST